nr:MAG TPA: hypothetical protein [Caudoviricetes sp.]
MLEVVVQILFFCSCVLLDESKDNASVVGVLSKRSRSILLQHEGIESVFSCFDVFREFLRIFNFSVLD